MVDLDYNEEVHWLVKQQQQRCFKLQFSGKSSFLCKGLRLSEKLEIGRTPLGKNVAMLVAMTLFSFMKVSTEEVLHVV